MVPERSGVVERRRSWVVVMANGHDWHGSFRLRRYLTDKCEVTSIFKPNSLLLNVVSALMADFGERFRCAEWHGSCIARLCFSEA